MATVSRYFVSQIPQVKLSEEMADISAASVPIEKLQQEWKTIFQTRLPIAATGKLGTQRSWPVHNDHCFARIILDHVVGKGVPWTAKLKSPAYKTMSCEQLQDCIELGERILAGKVDLVALDEQSLASRGKIKIQGNKRKMTITSDDFEEEELILSQNTKKMRVTSSAANTRIHCTQPILNPSSAPPTSPKSLTTLSTTLTSLPNHTPALSPYQTLVLTTLLQVPRGQYTTYGLLAEAIQSSPRAVGNALRNNPFAPQVPCHRVLASDGGLGGFKGSWGRGPDKEGKFDVVKRRLLTEEGVRFDGRGRVVGVPWRGFS